VANVDAGAGGVAGEQELEAVLEADGEGFGEGGEQDAVAREAAGEEGGAVEGDDALAGAGAAGDAGGAVGALLDDGALLGVEEDALEVPGGVEGGVQLALGLDAAEAALGVGVLEGVGGGRVGRGARGQGHGLAGGEVHEALGGFLGQLLDHVHKGALPNGGEGVDPLGGHPQAEQVTLLKASEERRLGLADDLSHDLFDAFAHFDELGGAGARVHVEAAALCPLVGVVVVGGEAEHEAARAVTVHDDAQIAVDAEGPEAGVAGALRFVEAEPRVLGLRLKLEGGLLDEALLVALEAGEAPHEGVGDDESHSSSPSRRCVRRASNRAAYSGGMSSRRASHSLRW
jgi:hypothetical protein